MTRFAQASPVATFTGAIAGLGIIVIGFCWSLDPDPTTALTTKPTNGGTTAGTYGAGQFIIKLYGAAVVS